MRIFYKNKLEEFIDSFVEIHKNGQVRTITYEEYLKSKEIIFNELNEE